MKKTYLAPSVQVETVRIEKGFATSEASENSCSMDNYSDFGDENSGW